MKTLLLNQCFYPDVMATAQQLTSLALGLRERGHEVTVITGDRGYDDHAKRFPRRETWRDIEIIRIGSLGLGKGAKWRRAITFLTFLIACSWRLLFMRRFDCVVGLTSPPLISLLGVTFARVKGGRFVSWVMDLNPDEAIAAGWLTEGAVTTRILGKLLRYSLRHSDRIVVLDRFMKQRIAAKGVSEEKIAILSPWTIDSVIYDQEGREAFRKQHGLTDRFVVMYSGNHSPCHPLDTLLDATVQLSHRDDIVFCFVGGGSEQAKVSAFASSRGLRNIICLGYQPLAELSGSLSAADLHVVVMGTPFVGIIHPCKVYNIMRVGKPFLYIGPAQSPIADLATEFSHTHTVYHAGFGEKEKVVAAILSATTSANTHVTETAHTFTEAKLMPQMIEILETVAPSREATMVDSPTVSTQF